jgi:hypothetical protein
MGRNNPALFILLLNKQVNISRVVMPDLIRHPAFSMDSGIRLAFAGMTEI